LAPKYFFNNFRKKFGEISVPAGLCDEPLGYAMLLSCQQLEKVMAYSFCKHLLTLEQLKLIEWNH
jgi:hypothetical protein